MEEFRPQHGTEVYLRGMKEISQTCEQILKILLEEAYLEIMSELKENRSEVQRLRSETAQLRRFVERSSSISFYFLFSLLVLNVSIFLYLYFSVNK